MDESFAQLKTALKAVNKGVHDIRNDHESNNKKDNNGKR